MPQHLSFTDAQRQQSVVAVPGSKPTDVATLACVLVLRDGRTLQLFQASSQSTAHPCHPIIRASSDSQHSVPRHAIDIEGPGKVALRV